jgi:hypothetical protein
MKNLASLLLTGLLLIPGARCVAQPPQGLQRPPDGGTHEVLVSILIPTIPNAPFSATVATEWIRQLADGSRITLVNRRAIARDNAGRIFQERRLLVPDDGKHESGITQIEISDPVSHDFYICVPQEHTCQVEFFSAPPFVPPALGAASAAKQADSPDREDLGKQFIGGVETVGMRETKIIEAGTIGNDSAILIRREYWYSPQLGVNLISKLQDPRVGLQNFEVSDIVLGEPDGNLFRVPPKSKVIDLRPTKVFTPPNPSSN